MEPEPRGPSSSGHIDSPVAAEGEISSELRDECRRQDASLPTPSSAVLNTVTTCRSSIAQERIINHIQGQDDSGEAYKRPEDPIAYPEHEQDPMDEDKVPGFFSMAYPTL